MNHEDYIERLDELLSSFPVFEREDAIEYVREFFEEEGNDQKAIAHLGSPEDYAASLKEQLKDDLPPEVPVETRKTAKEPATPKEKIQESQPDQPKVNGWKWAMLLLLSPLILALICAFLSFLLAAAILFFTIPFVLIVLIGSGVFSMAVLLGKAVVLLGRDPLGALFDVGLILICYAVVVLSVQGLKLFWTVCLPACINGLKQGVQKLKNKAERSLA